MNLKPLLVLLTAGIATASTLYFAPSEEAATEEQAACATEDCAEHAQPSNQ